MALEQLRPASHFEISTSSVKLIEKRAKPVWEWQQSQATSNSMYLAARSIVV